tara:strand:+ start:2860 stop:4599 length:1740 start_codon:yes stop_codon:yes gene_type:complete
MRFFSAAQYLDTDIVFLFEVEYLGRNYRFSSFPLSLSDGDAEILYEGGLEDPEFSLELGQTGEVIATEGSVSMALTFPFNVAKRQQEGRGIDRSKCRLYYVLSKNGRIQQTQEQRIGLMQGVISEPIYGHPDRENGYVEFSVVSDIETNDSSMLKMVSGDVLFLEKAAFSNPPRYPDLPSSIVIPKDPDGIIDVLDVHKGKTAPFVFGNAGQIFGQTGTTTTAGATPAYLIAYENVAPNFNAWYLIAGHDVTASTVKIHDNQGNSDDNIAVHKYVGSRGYVYSFIVLTAATPIDRSFVVNNDIQYWIEWDDGGGYPNVAGGGELTGGGDLIIWSFELLGLRYDRERWNAVRDHLNEYKFSGYVNDAKIKLFEWIQSNIIAYLPVSVANGPDGLFPIIDYRIDSIKMNPRSIIIESPEFRRVSPVEPILSDITNDLTVRFGPRGNGSDSDVYMSFATCTYQQQYTTDARFEIVSPYAIVSFQQYGTKPKVIELDFVYDMETAGRIAANHIKTNALPQKKISYRAAFRFGFLELGDIIEITDLDIGLDEYKGQICGKRYELKSWIYDILISENPIDNNRTL